MSDYIVDVIFNASVPQEYIGLSDKDCADPFGGIYTDKPFHSRCWPDRPPVPEMVPGENGDGVQLVEGIEWMWYWAWMLNPKHPPEADADRLWERNTRDNAGFHNNTGSDSKHSFVTGKNPAAKPMVSWGVDCPGDNLYGLTGEPNRILDGRECVSVWNLDAVWLAQNITKDNAKGFAASLPKWLVHTARICHPDDTVTNWDYDFCFPLMTGDLRRRVAVVEGLRCRENFMRAVRLSPLR